MYKKKYVNEFSTMPKQFLIGSISLAVDTAKLSE